MACADEEATSHRFFDEAYTNAGGAARRFPRAVLKEWDMLRDGLPPGIWVRAYESRWHSPSTACALLCCSCRAAACWCSLLRVSHFSP